MSWPARAFEVQADQTALAQAVLNDCRRGGFQPGARHNGVTVRNPHNRPQRILRTSSDAELAHQVSQQVEHLKIRLVKKAGVPRAEVEAHQGIQREFSSSTFSKGWRGYASFALARAGRGGGDDDLDLVLVKHTGIVLIELKNWNGKHLESNGHKWFDLVPEKRTP